MTAKEYNKAVEAWSDEVYRFALRSCGHVEEGQDIVQEAFASLWRQRGQVEAERSKHFLLRVAALRAKDFWRHRYREQGRPLEATYDRPHEQQELADALEQALASLTPLHRSILELREVQGYDFEEISNILNISDQQARVYLFRARVALQKKLKEYGYQS